MKKFCITLLTFAGIVTYSFAQVKTGSNPGTIQNGSLLELETKGARAGLKLAEVALTSTNDNTTVLVTAASKGMMVYNTATAGSGATAVTPGVYIHTGSAWVQAGSGGTASPTLYTTDGALTGNRTVAQGASTLAFTSTASTGTSHFTVDGTTLNVDAVNNRVGVGTAAPAGALDVSSTTGTLLPPRMTTLQRNALVTPPTGSVIFNTTTNSLEMNYGTAASPTWKTPVTSSAVSSNIVLAGGTSTSVQASNYGNSIAGVGYHQFTIVLPNAAFIKLDIYPSVFAANNNGLGTILLIDGATVGGASTVYASAVNTHTVVPYSYVSATMLSAGTHTIRIQANSNSILDVNDRITYSYLCWN